jgi:hypothetical protein
MNKINHDVSPGSVYTARYKSGKQVTFCIIGESYENLWILLENRLIPYNKEQFILDLDDTQRKKLTNLET